MNGGAESLIVLSSLPSDVSKTWTAPSSSHAADTMLPCASNDGPQTLPFPSTARVRSQTFSAPSSPVVASIEPSGENRTSLTSTSWPGNSITLCPDPASRISTIPESSGPSVTNTPVGLQSSAPPTPGTDSTMREAVTARCRASSASGRTVPSTDRVRSIASEREQDAALGVDLEVRDRCRRELASLRRPLLVLRLPLLARREHGQGAGDDRRDRQHGHQGPQPPHRATLELPLVLLAGSLLGLYPVPLGGGRVEELALLGGERQRRPPRHASICPRRDPAIRKEGSRSASAQSRAAAARRRSVRMSSLAASIHLPSRGHAERIASCASSIVGSPVREVTVRT